MTREQLMSIPPSHRRIETISPGLFFADCEEQTWGDDSWGSDREIAQKLNKESDCTVAFRRFIYDPEKGKTYLEKGWIYFKGIVIRKEDILSGEAERKHEGFTVNETLKANVKDNDIDVIWLKDFQKAWQFYDGDTCI